MCDSTKYLNCSPCGFSDRPETNISAPTKYVSTKFCRSLFIVIQIQRGKQYHPWEVFQNTPNLYLRTIKMSFKHFRNRAANPQRGKHEKGIHGEKVNFWDVQWGKKQE